MSDATTPVQDYVLRKATLADAAALARQRCLMMIETGAMPPEDYAELEDAVLGYLQRAMPAGTFHSWLVERGGEAVAGGGLQIRTLMPRPGYVKGEPEGLIVSMWTEPDHRRRGLGRLVVEAMIAWGRANGVTRLTLHASNAGRPLYALYGFADTNEMRLEIRA